MTHGAQQYFDERERFRTRVSAVTVAVASLWLAVFWVLATAPARRVLNDPEHFGFEGPERYVRRIELETYGITHGNADIQRGLEYVPRVRHGGGSGDEHVRVKETAPQLGLGPAGPGEAPEDLLARALRRSSDVPIVQSENLVFERLVRPNYPDDARQHGIEGRFSVVALIDTSGRVVEVEVQGGDADGILEREALAAVRQCLIRPYRVAGTPREIVARFPFNFYLRD
jgi:TonB family protein